MARLAAPDHQYVPGHCGFCSGLHFCLFVCFLKKERERAWNWMGGEDLGGDEEGENMIRTYCMNKYFNINE